MRIALTGGIACGKNLVAKFLRELGVQTLDADDVVHELEAPEGAAVPAIAVRFGQSVLAPDGGIDRAKLAALVFTGEERFGESDEAVRTPLQDLEAILHPLVRQRLFDFLAPDASCFVLGAGLTGKHLARMQCTKRQAPSTKHPKAPSIRIVIIPLLFESHFDSDYDIILCVSSTEDRQIDRMMQTRGYTREQAEARLAAQMPVAEKVARADWTIQNNSTVEELKAEVQRCVAWLSARMEKVV